MKKIKLFLQNYFNKQSFLFLKIVKFYFMVLGIFWILLYLYFRLFRSTNAYFLIDLKEHLNYKILLLVMIFVIIHFSVLVSIMLECYRNKYNKKPNSWIVIISQKLAKITDIIYWKPLNSIYEKYHSDIPGSGRFFIFLESRWTKKQRSKSYFYSMIFTFDIIPKIIMAIIFFIDIVIFNQIKYFFWVAPLVFLPIIFKLFIKLMISFSFNNVPVISDLFVYVKGFGSQIVNSDKSLISYEKYEYLLKEEYIDVVNPKEEMLCLLQLQRILFYMDQLKRDKEYFEFYCTILTSTLYLIAGIVRLFVIYY